VSWRDRDYNQINFGGRQISNPILNILFGSVPIGTWFGARIRIHSTLILYAIFRILSAAGAGSEAMRMAAVSLAVLFGIVLLHEYGHCIASRSVGGQGDEILMWMFGGLASVDTPHRPWPRFVAVAGGPLVNVIICLITGGVLLGASHFTFPLSFNPFNAYAIDPLKGYAGLVFMHDHPWSYYVWWIFAVSYSLFFFNLLPIFPLDGGQILQTMLWGKFGYYRATMFSCMAGMVASVGMGVWSLQQGSLFMAVLWVMCFITCFKLRQALKAQGPEEYENAIDYSAAYDNPSPRRRKMRKSWFKAARRRAMREQSEQARIDAILAKVHDRGLHSLTWFEKRALKKATERQRQRDLAERL
jgi:stage IV sporulation protein FB